VVMESLGYTRSRPLHEDAGKIAFFKKWGGFDLWDAHELGEKLERFKGMT